MPLVLINSLQGTTMPASSISKAPPQIDIVCANTFAQMKAIHKSDAGHHGRRSPSVVGDQYRSKVTQFCELYEYLVYLLQFWFLCEQSHLKLKHHSPTMTLQSWPRDSLLHFIYLWQCTPFALEPPSPNWGSKYAESIPDSSKSKFWACSPNSTEVSWIPTW